MRDKLIERFFNYVKIPSQSDANSKTLPSTKGQYELAKILANELKLLGLENIKLQDNAILSAKLSANVKNKKSVGFCAHLDTIDVGLSPVVNPQILTYKGEPILLNSQKQIYLDPKIHKELDNYINEEIIFSDGTSVLGADDKAAIAIIMTLLEYLIKSNVPRGDVYVCFLPDEEIGLRGAKALDLNDFPSDFAYTIDCCEKGEFVYETFNAGSAKINIQGISAHPMSAKGKLLNPTLVAVDIINCFDRLSTPENTENDEGYIWIQEFHSNQKESSIIINIRDHNRSKYEDKKAYISEVVKLTKKRYPRAVIDLEIEDVYNNIRDCINDKNKIAIDILDEAFRECKISKKVISMRGGTDGSALSAKGLLVPNFFTGAHNFHSMFEFLPISSFLASFDLSKKIVEIIAK